MRYAGRRIEFGTTQGLLRARIVRRDGDWFVVLLEPRNVTEMRVKQPFRFIDEPVSSEPNHV